MLDALDLPMHGGAMNHHERSACNVPTMELRIGMTGIMPVVVKGKQLIGKALRKSVAEIKKQHGLAWFKDAHDVVSLVAAATLYESGRILSDVDRNVDPDLGPESVRCDGKRMYGYWMWPANEQHSFGIGWAMGSPYWKVVMSLCDLCIHNGLFEYHVENHIEMLREQDLNEIEENDGNRLNEMPFYIEPWFEKKVKEAHGAQKHALRRASALPEPHKQEFIQLVKDIREFHKEFWDMHLSPSAYGLYSETIMHPIIWERGEQDVLNEAVDQQINDIWGNDTVVCDWSVYDPVTGLTNEVTGMFAQREQLRKRIVKWMEELKEGYSSSRTM